MKDLSDDEILKINPETDEIFSFTDLNDVIAMKISDNYCQFNIMNKYFRQFKQAVKRGNLHQKKIKLFYGIEPAYGVINPKTLPPNKVYVIEKKNSITDQAKYYIGYNVDSNVNIRLIIDTTNLTLAYEKFNFKSDDNDMYNQFTYTIYEPTDAVEEAYRNLLKIPTPKTIIDYSFRQSLGNQAGLDAESLHMLKEYTKSQNPNVFGFIGGTKTQKKKSNKHKKTNKQK